MKIEKSYIKLISIMFIIIVTSLSATYAFMNLVIDSQTDTSTAGCFEVNYAGEVNLGAGSLVSTIDYTQGAKATITLSKDEACKIYTTATIHIHTDSSPATSAPLSNPQALKYKVIDTSTGAEVTSNLDHTLIDGVITTVGGDEDLITVELDTDAITYDIYIWVDQEVSNGEYNGTTYSGYLYATSTQSSTVKE